MLRKLAAHLEDVRAVVQPDTDDRARCENGYPEILRLESDRVAVTFGGPSCVEARVLVAQQGSDIRVLRDGDRGVADHDDGGRRGARANRPEAHAQTSAWSPSRLTR